MLTPLRILGIIGSLRRGSYNTALLRNVPSMLPEGVEWLPVLTILGARWLHRPEFHLSNGGTALAPDGSLADPRTRDQFQKLLTAFVAFTRDAVERREELRARSATSG